MFTEITSGRWRADHAGSNMLGTASESMAIGEKQAAEASFGAQHTQYGHYNTRTDMLLPDRR